MLIKNNRTKSRLLHKYYKYFSSTYNFFFFNKLLYFIKIAFILSKKTIKLCYKNKKIEFLKIWIFFFFKYIIVENLKRLKNIFLH